jgi:hypothetical protein
MSEVRHAPFDYPDRTACSRCGVTITHVDQLDDVCRPPEGIGGRFAHWHEYVDGRCVTCRLPGTNPDAPLTDTAERSA